MATSREMTAGPALPLIFHFTMPLLLGNLLQQTYSLMDAAIVGKYLGINALASVGASSSVIFLILGFCNGCSCGFGIPVAQKFGARDYSMMRRYVAVSLKLSWIFSVAIAIVTAVYCSDILRIMQTPESIFEGAYLYLLITFLGVPCTFLYNLLSSIIRALGDSKTPFWFLLFSTVLNVLLDLFCILVLGWGVAGAAVATLIAQGVSAFLCYVYMYRHFRILRSSPEESQFQVKLARHLMNIGVPMGLQFSITAIGSIMLQSANNALGTACVAAFTSGVRIKMFFICPFESLGIAMATYCGQNLGAGKYERIFKGMKDAFWIGLATAVLASLICAGFGRYIVRLFLNSPTDEVMDYVTRYLNTISFFFIFLAFIYLYRTSLQGLGREIMPMISGIFETICRLATVAVLLKPAGYWSVCFANPVAWIGAGVPLMIAYLVWKQKIQKNILQKENE